MSYRVTKKRNKVWSLQANAKQARARMSGPAPETPMFDPDDDEIEIIITSPLKELIGQLKKEMSELVTLGRSGNPILAAAVEAGRIPHMGIRPPTTRKLREN